MGDFLHPPADGVAGRRSHSEGGGHDNATTAAATAERAHRSRRNTRRMWALETTCRVARLPRSPDVVSVKGCVDDVSDTLIDKIADEPEDYYVNIHNEKYPDGAIRGQLEK